MIIRVSMMITETVMIATLAGERARERARERERRRKRRRRRRRKNGGAVESGIN